MAAIGFDTLKTARRLKEAGVPEAQAEVQAEVMAEAFVFNMDALVTKDYLDQCLDARFGKFEAHFDRRLTDHDGRFEQQSSRFDQMDARLDQMDARFTQIDARFERIEERLHNHDLQFMEIRGELKLHRWMLALILATAILPYLQKLFVLLGG